MSKKQFPTTAVVAAAAVALVAVADVAAAAPFTPGNVAVYRVGDGSAALTSASTAVFIDEFSPTGTLVQSIALPTAAGGGNNPLTASGTSTSEGLLNRSSDGRYLVLTGYTSIPGATTAGDVVGRIDAAGTVNTATSLTDVGGTPRSAISDDGTDIWIASSSGGVRYTTLGGTTSVQLSTTTTNLRHVDIFGEQLYVSSMSGTTRVATVGTGLPTTSGQTIANLPGIAPFVAATPTAPATGNSNSPYQFVLLDLSAAVSGPDVLYVADDGLDVIQKFSLVDGTWTANGATATIADPRGLTGTASGSGASLYTTTGGATLRSVVDSMGYNETFTPTVTDLATAGANTAFRGVDFAPVAVPEPSALSLLALGGLAALRRRRRPA